MLQELGRILDAFAYYYICAFFLAGLYMCVSRCVERQRKLRSESRQFREHF
ncbi:ORF5a protein [Kafue kinda chacma baboon virus]|uniref:ORF5a protein n=1 Tax=Kafue kinda chacma baboon virus TaxID=1823757 RepID=A0A0Y0BTQ0_9NIDO|nr:ORF5a protein [Kafue kinda chacma baboon virus]AMB20719.1 ORF5a protein [Kafue kinda chacma baboon virus]AMV49342.1 ORF5a protein [Kafue kinda chacma baboon virus]